LWPAEPRKGEVKYAVLSPVGYPEGVVVEDLVPGPLRFTVKPGRHTSKGITTRLRL